MAVRIEVEKSGNNVALRAPEHPLLAQRAAALGGKSKGGAWTFSGSQENAVRALAKELWGTDGRDKETSNLRVELSLYGEGPMGRQGEAWLCGRLVARRRRFDAPVELGPDVRLVTGSFSTWGGSPGRPALGARYQTIVDITGVPRSAALAAERDYPFEVKVLDNAGNATVGAWARTVTERIAGPLARAEAKMTGKQPAKPSAPAARPAAPARKVAAAPPPPPPPPPPAARAKVKAQAAAKVVVATVKNVAAKATKAVAKAKKAAKKAAKAASKAAAGASQTAARAVAAAKKAARKTAKKVARKVAKKAPARKSSPASRRAAPAKPAKKAARKAAPARKSAARKAAPAKKSAARKRGRR